MIPRVATTWLLTAVVLGVGLLAAGLTLGLVTALRARPEPLADAGRSERVGPRPPREDPWLEPSNGHGW